MMLLGLHFNFAGMQCQDPHLVVMLFCFDSIFLLLLLLLCSKYSSGLAVCMFSGKMTVSELSSFEMSFIFVLLRRMCNSFCFFSSQSIVSNLSPLSISLSSGMSAISINFFENLSLLFRKRWHFQRICGQVDISFLCKTGTR